MAVAQAATPGPAAYAVQALILEAWAYLEALNDMELLYAGKPVPTAKKDCNWALSFENVIDSIFNEDGEIKEYKNAEDSNPGKDKPRYIEPDIVEGSLYADYLQVLTAALPQGIKVQRMMDLIQINMKYLYCDWFLLKEHFNGLKFSLEVNGKTYEFKEEY